MVETVKDAIRELDYLGFMAEEARFSLEDFAFALWKLPDIDWDVDESLN